MAKRNRKSMAKRGLVLAAGSALGAFGMAAPAVAQDPAQTLIYGVTLQQELVTFTAAAPGTILSTKPVTGFKAAEESLVGIDVRPATGQLFALSDTNQLYVLNPDSGALTAVGTPFSIPIASSDTAFDFNPTVDRIRIANEAGQNIRVNPNNGAVVDGNANEPGVQPDGTLSDGRGASGAAYTNSTRCPASTQLFYVDEGSPDQLLSSSNPNAGTVSPVGVGFGRDVQGPIGFDATPDGDAYASYFTTSQFDPAVAELARVDLTTGVLAPGTPIGADVEDIAIALPGAPLRDSFPIGGMGGVHVASGDVNADGCSDLVVGAGEGTASRVEVYSGKDGGMIASGSPFGAFAGGTRVAVVQADADSPREIVAAAGPGGGPNVMILKVAGGGLNPIASSFAFDPSFSGGVYVGAGNVDGTGGEEVVVGAGEGGGPVMRITTPGGQVLASTFAYDQGFKGGVRIAAGQLDGDAPVEIVTGAGPGGGPNVKVFEVTTAVSSFFSGPASTRTGVYVAAGDVVASAAGGEVITGSGAGSPPVVRTFSVDGTERSTLAPYATGFLGGVRVAAGDLTGNGVAGIITGAGPGGGPHVRVFEVS